jgi:hypothetical protein
MLERTLDLLLQTSRQPGRSKEPQAGTPSPIILP